MASFSIHWQFVVRDTVGSAFKTKHQVASYRVWLCIHTDYHLSKRISTFFPLPHHRRCILGKWLWNNDISVLTILFHYRKEKKAAVQYYDQNNQKQKFWPLYVHDSVSFICDSIRATRYSGKRSSLFSGSTSSI